jgi:hypothetical protein
VAQSNVGPGSGASALLAGLQLAPPQIINPYGLELETTGAQSIPNATFTPLAFGNQIYPVAPSPFWNAATNTWTVPLTGRYALSARCSLLIGTTGPTVVTWFIALFVNGIRVKNGQGALYTYPSVGISVTLSSILVVDRRYAGGDKIQIQGWHNYGVAQSTVGSSFEDWWTAHLISTLA